MLYIKAGKYKFLFRYVLREHSLSLAFLLIGCFVFLKFNFCVCRCSFLIPSIYFFLNTHQSPPSSEGICRKYKINRLYGNEFMCLKEIILKNREILFFILQLHIIKIPILIHWKYLQLSNLFLKKNFGPLLACTFFHLYSWQKCFDINLWTLLWEDAGTHRYKFII